MDMQNIMKMGHDRIDLFPIDRLALAHLLKVAGERMEDYEALAGIKKDGTYDAIMGKFLQ